MKKINILLADDHIVVRQGLRMLIEHEEDMAVVGEADTGRQAVQMARKLHPDVLVLDVAMPHLNGLEVTKILARELPDTRILVLSSYSDEEYVKQLTQKGACGYLVKQTAANDLIKAIREAHRGNAFFSPSISRRFLDQCRDAFDEKKTGRLTAREAEVLHLIAQGRANKQIAADLGISIKTVEKHRQQVMNKLGIHDVAGLTRHAISKGIVQAAVESTTT